MRKDSLFGKVGLKFTKIDIESVLDFCATKSYELPLNAVVFDKNISSININIKVIFFWILFSKFIKLIIVFLRENINF